MGQPAHQVQSDLRTCTFGHCHQLKMCFFTPYTFLLGPITSQRHRQFCISTLRNCLITSNLMPQPRKPVELTPQSEAHGLRSGVSATSTAQPKTPPPTVPFCDSIKSFFRNGSRDGRTKSSLIVQSG